VERDTRRQAAACSVTTPVGHASRACGPGRRRAPSFTAVGQPSESRAVGNGTATLGSDRRSNAITGEDCRREKSSAPATPDKKIITAGGAPATTWDESVAGGAATGKLATLSVASQPVGASVWINGKERGRTPVQVKLQSSSAHVVLVLAGYASATIDVTVAEGARVSKELLAVEPPLTGDARFRAECTTQGKLPIVVDGKETGVMCPSPSCAWTPAYTRLAFSCLPWVKYTKRK